MFDFTIETEISAPPAAVFACVIDPGKLASWQTNTVSVEVEGGGPLALGSRLREVHRGPGGREVPSLVEVSEFEPERSFALRMIEGPLPVDAHISLAHAEPGTRMAFRVSGRPRGLMRLAQPILEVLLKRQFAEHCANLKRLLERGPTATTSVSAPDWQRPDGPDRGQRDER